MAQEIDRIVGIVGAGITALFCGFLAILIFRARRGVKSDRWLAVVLGGFFAICVYAAVRTGLHLVYIPFIASALWAAIIIAESIAAVSLLEEMAAVRAVRKAEAEAAIRLDARLDAKLEPSVARNEAAAARTEAAADRIEETVGSDELARAKDRLDARTQHAIDGG